MKLRSVLPAAALALAAFMAQPSQSQAGVSISIGPYGLHAHYGGYGYYGYRRYYHRPYYYPYYRKRYYGRRYYKRKRYYRPRYYGYPRYRHYRRYW